jgi:hypothetical protein
MFFKESKVHGMSAIEILMIGALSTKYPRITPAQHAANAIRIRDRREGVLRLFIG